MTVIRVVASTYSVLAYVNEQIQPIIFMIHLIHDTMTFLMGLSASLFSNQGTQAVTVRGSGIRHSGFEFNQFLAGCP